MSPPAKVRIVHPGPETSMAQRVQRAQPGWQRRLPWARSSDAEILDLPLRDLGLKLDGTWVQACIERLYAELAARGLNFRPHCWISQEWFSPDGVPGIAVPFYLLHPRLRALERRQMFEVEGGTPEWCLRILRHEAGHAFDSAWRLHRRASWRDHFGSAGRPYPHVYQVDPRSRAFVHNLEWWYAQSHPVEDFAETFAVWLQRGRRALADYEGWSARNKLEYVDDLARSVAGRKAPITSRKRVDPISSLRTSLRTHYEQRRAHYGVGRPDVFDVHLRRVFEGDRARGGSPSAAAFLRAEAPELRRRVARWTGQHPYTVEQFLREMTIRSRALGLKVRRARRAVRLEAAILLTVQVMQQVQGRRYPVIL